MRLINADNYKDKVIATVGYSGLYWLADINDVPTAYDVEKVIKKINSKIQELDVKQKVFMEDGLFGLADNVAKKMEIYIECREIIENGGMTIDKNKKQTNADKIRAMSDEDLAFFLFSCTPHVEGEYMECIKSIEKMLKEDACPNFRSNSDVKAQETAYNVDKVVEQLEWEKDFAYADFERYAEEKGLDKEQDFFSEGMKRAIEIVKGGGIDA